MRHPRTGELTPGLCELATVDLCIGVLVLLGLVAVRAGHEPRPAAPVAIAEHRVARTLLVPPSPWWSTALQHNTPEAWDVAAAVYDLEARRCMIQLPVGQHDDCVDAAFAALLARQHAWSVEALPPGPYSPDRPARVQALMDASDTFVVLAFPDDRGWLLDEFRIALLLWSLRQERIVVGLTEEARADRLSELRDGVETYMHDPRCFVGNDVLQMLGLVPR